MTHGKVRHSDFAVIDAILVCLNLSENYHTAFTTILLASFAPTFLDRENYYYHNHMPGYRQCLCLLFGTSLALIQ